MTTTPKIYALIAAAGNGSRLGGEKPKQYQLLAGKPVLRHTVETFVKAGVFDGIRVIIAPQHAELYHDAVKGLDIGDPIHGGKERKDSVYKGLEFFAKVSHDDIVLIHDAARPFVTIKQIKDLIAATKTHKVATLATGAADTLMRNEGAEYVNRDGLWNLQTPQGFHYGLILQAHKQHNTESAWTDDTSMLAAQGHPIHIVEGSRKNFKITTPDDLTMAEQLMKPSFITLTGQGYDVHTFEDETEGPVRLCGVDVPHRRALAGHSDADVGLHAITDALLGAMGDGDIGRHFPPSDNTFKDMDSAIFLRKAVEMPKDKGGKLLNIDLTLICEEPKIGPHAALMQQRVAEIAELNAKRVNIKATTTEGLGFTGRKEGIAAQAITTINLPEEA